MALRASPGAATRKTAIRSRHRIPLGNILGIEIGLDYSWFLIFALLTWTLAASYYPVRFPGWSAPLYWCLGALSAVLLFAGVLLHELGHSIVARKWNVPVRRITLFIFGGVAEIAEQPPSAAAEFWIAVAGPAVSLTLALLFGILAPLVSGNPALFGLCTYLAFVNGALFLFNLVPGFPLDGGRVFRSVVWGLTDDLARATRIAANVGRFIGFGFILFGVWQLLDGNVLGGVWIMLIGWFLESAAVAQVHRQQARNALEEYRVSNVMSRECETVTVDERLSDLVESRILGSGRRCFLVRNGGSFAGLVTLHQVRKVDRERWPSTTVGEVMVPLESLRWIAPDTGLWEALREMDRDGVNQLPVLAGGELVGLLSREDVISFLQTVRDLRGKHAESA